MLVDNCSDGTYSGGGHASQAGLYTCSSSIPVAKIASQIPNWTQYDDDIRYGCHVMFKVK